MANLPGADGARLAALFSILTSEEEQNYSPFLWQKRLLGQFLKGNLPRAVDVATGLGKTSVMALWLIALAEGVKLPRRLVYIVDRRAVVDQATRFAERLRRNMPSDLADRLRITGGTGALPISTLRGGFADNRDWLEDPTKPAIVVGTIDMIGSRLLFEGYGVSRRMRPYHAGFLGVDTLVLLDEAHLCPPFEALLRQIAFHRDGKFGPAEVAPIPVTPPFHLMSLSATGRELAEMPSDSVFRLEQRDFEEALVKQRLMAKKLLRVHRLENAMSLSETVTCCAIKRGCDGDTPCRVLIYCDHRKEAVKVKELIDKEYKRREKVGELNAAHESQLLVGARRVYERTKLESWLERTGFLGGAQTPPKTPTFLVATSAGEVGVDLDADHLVCDLVAYERMVQRFGRVNRRGGQSRTAMIDVFAVQPSDLKANANKAMKYKHEKEIKTYEQRMAVLQKLPCDKDGRYDASPAAAVQLKHNHPDMANAATTPAPLYPELTRPLVDAWAMTSLECHEGRPDVAPWLRGWEEENKTQTEVIWRKHLPLVRKGTDISAIPAMTTQFFRTAPIHASEKLEAASAEVFDWLLKRASEVHKRPKEHESAIKDQEIVALLINRAGEYVESVKFGKLRYFSATANSMSKIEKRDRDRQRDGFKRLLSGALVIVDKRIRGLRDGLLDQKCDLEVPVADADKNWRDGQEDPLASASRPIIRFRIEEIVRGDDGEGVKSDAQLEDWRHNRTFETDFDAGGVPRRGLAVYKWPDEVADEGSRSILSAPQTLADHARQAAARAREMAVRLKLPDEEVDALSIAAKLHDDGKAAERWQNAMNAPKDDRPYAKTTGGGNWRLLEGYRHEFGSLLRAERKKLPNRMRDLILHLIAAHHGNSRPLISSAGCEDGPPSLLESRAGEAALRFARLQKRYGPWGLAWREAILRAADQSASRAWVKLIQEGSHG